MRSGADETERGTRRGPTLEPATLTGSLHPSAQAPRGRKEHVAVREVDRPDRGLTVDGEADHDGELAVAGEELLRPVEGVDDPDPVDLEALG